MIENEPAKEKETIEVVKIEFVRTYDTTLAGHDPYIHPGEYYWIEYPSGLHIALGVREDQEGWGHWNYDRKTGTKKWEVFEIPENPRVITVLSDGRHTEMSRLIDIWLETHESLDGEECSKFIYSGVDDFLKRTGQG